ncbi:MAG: zinc ribbon domain-containing protein [Actinomycetes bacterium]
MADVTDEQLDHLLALQDLDTRVSKLEHDLADLPEQRALQENEDRRRQLGEEHDQLRLEIETLGAQQRTLERELDTLRQRKAAEQQRLYGGEVHNQREMQSVEAEIAATETRIDGHEEQVLGLMEQADELESRAEALAAERDELAAGAVDLAAARDDAAAAILAQKAELEVQRDAERGHLGADLLEDYDRIREKRGGVAVGELTGNACSACRIEMPMVEVRELRHGDPLTRCPECARLLVVRD